MKKTVRVFAVLLSVLLMISMAACRAEEVTSPEESVPSDPQPAVSETPTVETTPEPTPAPEEEGAVPTPAPESDDVEESPTHSSLLPMPESGNQDFVAEFVNNPIDAKYEEDLSYAASMVQIVKANNTAAESWKSQIDSVYMQILEIGDEATVEQVKASQTEWLDQQNDQLQQIRNAVSSEDTMASVTVAENIMLYYRSSAIDLSVILYELEGQVAFG